MGHEVQVSSSLVVKFVDSMGSDARITQAAKVSTEGEESWGAEAKDGLIRFLMKNRHGTPFEHNALQFFVKAPIAVFREFHRHRIGFSYNEESGRYRELRPEFYVPPAHRPLVQVGKPGAYEFIKGTPEQYSMVVKVMTETFKNAYAGYQGLLGVGIAREVARGVLPVYLYSSMYVTMNTRSLMSLLSLRTKGATEEEYPPSLFPSFPMWEIEQVARGLEVELRRLFPLTHKAFREFGSVAP